MSDDARQTVMGLTYGQLAVAGGAALTLARIVLLFGADANLGPDEAQYWDWSRDLAFGYFSKPPMIAWLIAATTAVCGDGEACVRLSSPLIHFATSLVLYVLARDLYGAAIGFLTAAVFLTLPGVSFSAVIASTDVPLLFFWSAALLALNRWLTTGATRWAIMLGLALGFGVLSKYAMGYFLLCAAVYFVMLPERRRALLRENLLVVIGLAFAVVAPNMWWNLQHGFATFEHTAANAHWTAGLFNIGEVMVFVRDQAALFGPILFAALLWIAFVSVRQPRSRLDGRALYLLSFSLPVLAILVVQSLLSRSNANWAAASYPAATVIVTAWLWQNANRALLSVSFALHGVACAVLAALLLSPGLVDALGADSAFKRARGWDGLAAAISSEAARSPGASALLFDDRLNMTEFLYYGRDTSLPAYIWDDDGIPENHYELTRAYTGQIDGPILLVSRQKERGRLLRLFAAIESRGTISIPLGRRQQRIVYLYLLSGYRGQ